MQFIPDNKEVVGIKETSALSDALVLLVTVLLLVISVCFPIWRAAAETETGAAENNIVLSLTEGEYSALLSSLFGRVNKEVPEDAYEYIRSIDEYRIRVAQSIEENNRLVQVLYILIENLPRPLKEGYEVEINEMKQEAGDLKVEIFPYIENDTFLSDAVIEKYELYQSFTEWLVSQINQKTSVVELNKIQVDSNALRRDIALLYARINSIIQKRGI